MDPIDLADRELSQYKRRNGEIIAEVCPFCHPRKKDNLYKFYVNEDTGAYMCYRKNHCGATGSFYELLKHFGLEDEFEFDDDQDFEYQKQYKKPQTKTEEPTSKVEEYLDLRCISKEIYSQHNVKEKNGNIAFEYYHHGELVLIKYRTASKDKRYWQDGGGKPVLWGIDDINTEKPLVICEGELDKLAIHEAGYDNVVSVPFGTNNLDWVELCWDDLEDCEDIVIWADNDKAGKEMEEKVSKRLGKHRCRIVDVDYNDANLMLFKEDKKEILKAIEDAEKIPITKLKQLSEIERFDPASIPKVKSNVKLINKFLGGYMEGMITIWTGTNGSGKSTFLNQQAIEAVEQDKPTCVVSGELPNSMLRYWLELQAAGPKNVETKHDEFRDDISYYVSKNNKEKIRSWADGRLFIYDSFESLKPHSILQTFIEARMRYNIRHFIVDNLMIVNFEASHESKYSKQAQFVKSMKDFAKNYDAHVHIVAHPRKPKGIITKEDIAGLYEVTNHADNVCGVIRVTDKIESKLPDKLKEADNILEIFKCRLYGKQDISIRLMFDEPSKRFFQFGDNDGKTKQYSWSDY